MAWTWKTTSCSYDLHLKTTYMWHVGPGLGLGIQAQVPVPSPTLHHPNIQDDEDSGRGLVFKGILANMPLVASLHHSTSSKTLVVCTLLSHAFMQSAEAKLCRGLAQSEHPLQVDPILAKTPAPIAPFALLLYLKASRFCKKKNVPLPP